MPDQENPDNPDSTSDQKSTPCDSVEEQQEKGAEKGTPTATNPRNNRGNRIVRCFRKAGAEWKTIKLHDKLGVWFEGTGLFVLLVYTIFTALMYCANKEAADAAKSAADTAQKTLTQSIESFRTDERAWVEIDRVQIDRIEKIESIPPSPPPSHAFLKYAFVFKNFGKTVATNVRIHIDNPGSTTYPLESDEAAIKKYQDKLWRDSATGKKIQFPDAPGPQTIAPGATSNPISSGGQEPFFSGKNIVHSYIIGRVDYIDAFNTTHWMKFCFVIWQPNGELGSCQYGNYEDDSPEKSQAH